MALIIGLLPMNHEDEQFLMCCVQYRYIHKYAASEHWTMPYDRREQSVSLTIKQLHCYRQQLVHLVSMTNTGMYWTTVTSFLIKNSPELKWFTHLSSKCPQQDQWWNSVSDTRSIVYDSWFILHGNSEKVIFRNPENVSYLLTFIRKHFPSRRKGVTVIF